MCAKTAPTWLGRDGALFALLLKSPQGAQARYQVVRLVLEQTVTAQAQVSAQSHKLERLNLRSDFRQSTRTKAIDGRTAKLGNDSIANALLYI